MAAVLEIGAHTGSPEASKAVVPVFMKAMKPAGEEVPITSLDPPVKTLAFLLRVSGQFRKFEEDPKFVGEMVGNVKFERGAVSVSVDLVLTIADWEGKSNAEIAEVLGRRAAMAPLVLEPSFKKRKLAFDRGLLEKELGVFIEKFRARAAGL